MPMDEFIERTLTEIVHDWESFARGLSPAAKGMTPQELRDFASDLLRAIAEDMRSAQSRAREHDKSRGYVPDNAPNVTRVARSHAEERLSAGFTLKQLIAEYRALRADVVRRWRDQLPAAGSSELDELTRFNESVDQALAESVDWYFERLEDARDLLNGVLAHDLRNPLGTILVSLEFLLMSNLDSPYIKAASHIRKSARRMETMINELLDFTRTRLGSGLPVTPGDADLGLVCQHIVDELGAFHPDAHLHLELTGDLKGRWDPARIEQLMSNLISNAIEHGDDDGKVSISAHGERDEVVVSVHNTGTPIAPSEQKSIFDPLRSAAFRDRSGATRSAGGLGLGLYISREIAEGHGGSIEVTSDDTGTTFTVRLPREFRQARRRRG